MARWAVESWAIALGVIAMPVPTSTPPVPVQPIYRAAPQTPVQSGQAQGLMTPHFAFEPQMVRIAAGEFLMGSTPEQVAIVGSWAKNEQPQHRVMLAAYAIGKYPITCRQYQAFVQDSGYPAPQGWSGSQHPVGKADHPVVYVSWEDSQAYCVWLSHKTGKPYRLPSEAEWEKAARGTDGRIYP